MDGALLEQVSELKYLGYVLDESSTDIVECCRKMMSGRQVPGAISSFFNARGLHLQCVEMLHEGLLMPVLI